MNLIVYNSIAVIIGLIIDCILGDPHGWPHIIIGFGKIVSFYEKLYYDRIKNKFVGGFCLTVSCLLTVAVIIGGILGLAMKISLYLYIAVEAIICWQLIAIKSLKVETKLVYDDLKRGDLEAARHSVSMVVGRDTQNLTVEGVTKAAVETVAENTADGIAAPLFYMIFGGAFLGAIYKIINTMDSMVGYKNDRYMHFGTCSARLDDVAGYIPARLCAFAMILASFLLGMDGKNAYKMWKRDRYNHASPNSAHTEAVMAGALDIQLAGDAYYFGKLHKKKFIGDKIREVEIEDIVRAHRLLNGASAVLVVIMIIVRIIAYAAL